jgi:nucleoid-associated protein YgaU
MRAMSERVKNGISSAEWLVGSEQAEPAGTEAETTQTTETLELIPIEQVPAGEVTKLGEAQSETQSGTETETQGDEQPDASADVQDEPQAEASASTEPQTYIVKSGDTLTGISLKLYGTNRKASEIAELNQLENSDDIREGQKLLLP